MDWKYLFNTDVYSIPELVLCCTGGAMWAILYVIMLFRIRKYKYVEMPYFVAAGNIAWEFLWAWVFSDLIDLGAAYVFLYRAWFFLDCLIFYYVVRYGSLQTNNPHIKKHFKPIVLGTMLIWMGLIFSFVKSGYDLPLGVNSAYILNLAISVLYILLFMRQRESGDFSKAVAWLKMLGSGVITIAFWTMIPKDSHFEHFAGPVVFVIDCVYIWMLYNWKHPQLDPPFDPKAIAMA